MTAFLAKARSPVAKHMAIQQRTSTKRLLDFMGSMNLAITLLVVLAIASVIGTVLQQNQPYTDYVAKFGPFWFEVFDALGLFDVYSTGWFLAILSFLVLSTTTCIYRNTPAILRDMRQFRETAKDKSLRALHHTSEWRVENASHFTRNSVERLKRSGFRVREHNKGDVLTIAGLKGRASRLGYLFTHSAIVLICIGGLIDGNIPLKVRALSGNLSIETRNVSIKEIPDSAILSPDNPAFRASVSIPEGKWSNAAYISLRDGYLVQQLPFNVKVKDFRIEHYPTGQPKSFESDLLVWDPADPDNKTEQTIAVNHPMSYKGYTIYQASFSDGGSSIEMKIWPLRNASNTTELAGKINQTLALETSNGKLNLELDDFRLFNINPVEDPKNPQRVEQKNFGPSIQFKLRDQTGQAVEMDNYLLPIEKDGLSMFMAGVRNEIAEPIRYLYIPADSNASPERFMRFLHLLLNQKQIGELANRSAAAALGANNKDAAVSSQQISQAMVRLTGLFAREGFDGLAKVIETEVPEAERESVALVYQRVLQHMLETVYLEVLAQEGINTSDGMSTFDSQFLDSAINAIATLPYYPSPVFVQFTQFEQLQSSGLQITRAPGKDLVYLGSTLLILGIFAMFYLPHRRIWLRVFPEQQGYRVLMAGAAARNRYDFDREFAALATLLKQKNQH